MLLTFISEPPSAVFGLSPSVGRARLVEAIPEAYERVVSAAIDNRVDFVVIAGDIFDTARPSYADYLTFFDGLSRLDAEGIPVYMCTGNHDPYTTWQRDLFNLPGNVTMFSADKPSFAFYRRDGKPVCVLGGRGYYNQTWPWGCLHRRGRYAICRKRGPRGGRGIGSLRHRGNSHRARSGSEQGPRGAREAFACGVRLLGARACSQTSNLHRGQSAPRVFRMHPGARHQGDGAARCEPGHARGGGGATWSSSSPRQASFGSA